jgi:NADH:ubiquinone reductase (non-electrogenic)
MVRIPGSSWGLNAAMRRSFATSTNTRPWPRKLLRKSSLINQAFRRAYADAAQAKKPRRFRFFTYLWRLTYLSALGGTAFLGFGVWELRHPENQLEPDPNKKNLVILGGYPN